jgi:hypothetical protein
MDVLLYLPILDHQGIENQLAEKTNRQSELQIYLQEDINK